MVSVWLADGSGGLQSVGANGKWREGEGKEEEEEGKQGRSQIQQVQLLEGREVGLGWGYRKLS